MRQKQETDAIFSIVLYEETAFFLHWRDSFCNPYHSQYNVVTKKVAEKLKKISFTEVCVTLINQTQGFAGEPKSSRYLQHIISLT
jgi:hypothetical protein